VVLENAIVRAAAVTALAKFGAGECGVKHPDVKESVVVLLTRCLDDPDDEVRDRAALNLKLIQDEDQTIAERFIKNGRWIYSNLSSNFTNVMFRVYIFPPCFRTPTHHVCYRRSLNIFHPI